MVKSSQQNLAEALQDCSQKVEQFLTMQLQKPAGYEAKVVEAMRYALFAGGKRLRPFLVMASASLFDVHSQQAVRVAAAIEAIHTYSLVHDDLPAMDDDDLRRGKPTTHKQFDEATAILAGDALQSFAFEILASEETHPDAGVRIELVHALAKASGHSGMVGGQMIDMMAADHPLSEEDIYRLQQLKTGALINFSVEAAAILGKADNHQRQHLCGYARDLGLAFQIADDLLDVESTVQETGKAVGKDAAAGKATLLGLMGIERARKQAQILVDQAIDHLEEFGEKASLLRAVAHFAINRRT